jgi:hypothetical protein
MKWEIRCTTLCTYICHVEAPSQDAVDKFYEWAEVDEFIRIGEADWELSCIDNAEGSSRLQDFRHIIHINEKGEVVESLPDV